jgi:hypothetical protein
MTALPFTQTPLEANGDIYPRRFIVGVAGTGNLGVQATGSTIPILGVSYDKLRYPPNSPADDGKNAVAGEQLSYHGWGTIARVDIGTDITDLTVPVTSDGSGKAKPVSFAGGQTALVWIAGLPLDIGTSASGASTRVYILPPSCVHPALS